MSKRNQHVVPNRNGGWDVKGAGNERATAHFKTQKQAISRARELAIKNRSELLIHGKDRKIREKNSYGNDDFPPRG